jgi:hypothetical protein
MLIIQFYFIVLFSNLISCGQVFSLKIPGEYNYKIEISHIYADDAPKSSITGKWKGILIQYTNPKTICNFELKLKQEGNNLNGTSRIEQPRSIYFGIMELKGSFLKNILNFKEIKIISQKTGSNWSWCIKKGRLTFNQKVDSLVGPWEGCKPEGVIKLRREK